MKKTILLFTFVFCSFIVQAQNTSKLHFGFELRPGYSFLSTNLKNGNSLNGGRAISLGLPVRYVMYELPSFEYSIASGIYIKNNIGRIEFNGQYPDNDESISVEQDVKAMSLEIPVLVYLNMGENGILQTGFAINYLLKASGQERIEFNYANLSAIRSNNVDFMDKFRKLGLTYEVALGMDFSVFNNIKTYGLFNLSFMISNCLKEFDDYQGSNGYPIDEDGNFYNFSVVFGVYI